MRTYFFPENDGRGTYAMIVSDLMDTKPVHTGEWQAMSTEGSPAHATHEIEDVSLVWEKISDVAGDVHNLVPYIDNAWATEHFEERVSGKPLNPAPSHERWPYAVGGNARHTSGGLFDHTYPERFWPTHPEARIAPVSGWNDPVSGVPVLSPPINEPDEMRGIRFRYGDLGDVVDLLVRSPLTRQAYLPVWFPEDTGAHHGQRVPCTLGYHFMIRDGLLSCRYYLRSCDIYRHFSNDVFFTAALMNWVCNQVNRQRAVHKDDPIQEFRPGKMVMHIASLHGFVGDRAKIMERVDKL